MDLRASGESARQAVVPAWGLSETQRLIEHPAIRLLRSPNAPLTLTFLHRAFKEHHVVSIPESQLRARLDNLLDEAREQRPGSYSQSASDYLALWCGPEQVLLKKFYSNEADEPVFELTTAAEHAMQWLEDLHARPFVGAESRLELIFRQLEEIALFSTSDVERRVAALRAQKAALDQQIESMERTQIAQTYTTVQLSEDDVRARGNMFRQSPPAVCIAPGTRLLLQDIPKRLQQALGLGDMEEVTFTQLTAEAYRFRDAIRFKNGQELLLQWLSDGQHVIVLGLPTHETTAEPVDTLRMSSSSCASGGTCAIR
jgi:Protein of unknown function (DUF3375)